MTQTAVAPKRDTRFKPGNRAAAGPRHASKVSQFRSSLFTNVSAADFREVVRALVTKAKAGQGWAIQLTLKYLVGEPQTNVSITHHDAGALSVAQAVQDLLSDQRASERALEADERFLAGPQPIDVQATPHPPQSPDDGDGAPAMQG